jgi:hypothetical protein
MTALTVLQPMSMYRALQQWCSRAGIAAGTPDLSPHDVVHALVLRLLADPDLAADVTADLKEEAQARAVVGTFVPAGEAKRGTSHRAPGSRR